jgi:hypothetical protein
MAVDEVRTRLRERLEEEYGVEEAGILMDRPPGGWSDLVTRDLMRQEFDRFEDRFEAKIDLKFDAIDLKLEAFKFDLTAQMERGFREQTWRLMTASISSMALLVAALSVFVALTR